MNLDGLASCSRAPPVHLHAAIRIKSPRRKRSIHHPFLKSSQWSTLFLSFFSLTAEVEEVGLVHTLNVSVDCKPYFTRYSPEDAQLSRVMTIKVGLCRCLTSRVCINVGLMASFINTARAPLTPCEEGRKKEI